MQGSYRGFSGGKVARRIAVGALLWLGTAGVAQAIVIPPINIAFDTEISGATFQGSGTAPFGPGLTDVDSLITATESASLRSAVFGSFDASSTINPDFTLDVSLTDIDFNLELFMSVLVEDVDPDDDYVSEIGSSAVFNPLNPFSAHVTGSFSATVSLLDGTISNVDDLTSSSETPLDFGPFPLFLGSADNVTFTIGGLAASAFDFDLDGTGGVTFIGDQLQFSGSVNPPFTPALINLQLLASVSEPPTWLLLGIGFLGAMVHRRRSA